MIFKNSQKMVLNAGLNNFNSQLRLKFPQQNMNFNLKNVLIEFT